MVGSNSSGAPAGVRTQVTCSNCGKETSVPFTPTPGRPVFCRECFASRGGGASAPSSAPRPAPASGGGYSRDYSRGPPASNTRQRMMAQGRKGHFMHDAKAVLVRLEGGMDEQHIRAFLEGLFARGARQSTAEAQAFLDEKQADETITPDQRHALGQLVERYSFWR